MPDAEFAFIGKLLEYGVTSAVLAWGWYRAEQRADRAQSKADERVESMAALISQQVQTNEKVTTAIGLQGHILDRISTFIDKYAG